MEFALAFGFYGAVL